MAKFKFQLEPLLKVRERVERDRQLAVAQLENEKLQIEAAIRERQKSIDAARYAARSALEPGKSINLGHARKNAVAALHYQADAQASTLKLAGLYKRINDARQELTRATAARRAIELIKEQRKQEHQRQQNRKEAELIDELATINAARRRGATP